MSHQPNMPQPAGAPEAEACLVVNFHVMNANGHVSIEQADCLITSRIGSLKNDLQTQLGPADNQNWYYNNQLMSDNRNLRDYGITGDEDGDIIIKVNP